MGRRSINTTKSGKFLNPTDQARKEARMKELKKNKKQRQMIRTALLKRKNPLQLIEEMEKIDKMEYDVLQPPPLNEIVLKSKRKKLRETLDRVLRLYKKDDPDKWLELKRSQLDYERRRNQLVQHFEAVKHAQQVSLDDIPLPPAQPIDNTANTVINQSFQFPLLNTDQSLNINTVKPGVLKRMAAYGLACDKEPPGVPPGPPPDLSSCSEEEDNESLQEIEEIVKSEQFQFLDDVPITEFKENEEKSFDSYNESEINLLYNKPTSVQQRMVQISGQNVEEFLKDIENAQKGVKQNFNVLDKSIEKTKNKVSEIMMPPRTDFPRMQQVTVPPFSNKFFRSPPAMPRYVMPSMGFRSEFYPGHPSLPPGLSPGLPPQFGLWHPLGPTPGMFPRLIQFPVVNPRAPNTNVVSAPPQLIKKQNDKPKATITAQPQIKNFSADVTRFIPSTVRTKRENKKDKNATKRLLSDFRQDVTPRPASETTKDEAYKQFMKEMEELL